MMMIACRVAHAIWISDVIFELLFPMLLERGVEVFLEIKPGN